MLEQVECLENDLVKVPGITVPIRVGKHFAFCGHTIEESVERGHCDTCDRCAYGCGCTCEVSDA